MPPVEKIKATVTILTYHSAKTLEACLKSVQSFDEILVVDGGSTDETTAIAVRFGARVIPQSDAPGPINDFSAVRERSFQEAKHNWILWLDSDEWADEKLLESIREVMRRPADKTIYAADRVPIVDGKEIRYAYFLPDRVLRFVDRRWAHWVKGKKVHERLAADAAVRVEHIAGSIFTPWASLADYKIKDRYYLSLAFSRPMERRPPLFAIARAVIKNALQAVGILCQAVSLSLRYGKSGAVLPWRYHVRFAAYHALVARERIRQFVYGKQYVPPSR